VKEIIGYLSIDSVDEQIQIYGSWGIRSRYDLLWVLVKEFDKKKVRITIEEVEE